jgi:hypothetical protein
MPWQRPAPPRPSRADRAAARAATALPTLPEEGPDSLVPVAVVPVAGSEVPYLDLPLSADADVLAAALYFAANQHRVLCSGLPLL